MSKKLAIYSGVYPYPTYTITAGGLRRQVSEIKFYDETGVVLATGDGYLTEIGPDKKPIQRLVLETNQEIKLKRKLKFDGEIFVMNDDRYSLSEKTWALYIPAEFAEFKKVSRKLQGFDHKYIVDRYESELLNAQIDHYRNDIDVSSKLNKIRKDFNDIVKGYSFSISDDITDDLKKLAKLKKEYDKERERVDNLDLSKL